MLLIAADSPEELWEKTLLFSCYGSVGVCEVVGEKIVDGFLETDMQHFDLAKFLNAEM